MSRKLMIQTCICLLLITGIAFMKNSQLDIIQTSADAVLNRMSVSYTKEDIKYVADKAIDVFNELTGKPIYGEPIDKIYEDDETPVYAVAGGRITAVGENEEIGRYIRITHGDSSESLYGNLNDIKVTTPENVKKGQIIGTYSEAIGREFYYSFKEF